MMYSIGILGNGFVGSAIASGFGLHADVKIYDVSGRLINTIINRDIEPGYHSVKWNGRNFSGDAVPTGIYFIQVESGKDLGLRKIMLIK